jgi:uncharacterized membrane protein
MSSTTPQSTIPLAEETTATAPPRDLLKITSIGLSLIGIGIAGYLTYTKLTNATVVCSASGGFNCDLVQSTIYSQLLGIPIQYIGLGGYLSILAVLLLESRIPFLKKNGLVIVFMFTLFGFLYSAYLTAMEAFVIHAWCMWCVFSAITMTALFIASVIRLLQMLNRPVTLADLETIED